MNRILIKIPRQTVQLWRWKDLSIRRSNKEMKGRHFYRKYLRFNEENVTTHKHSTPSLAAHLLTLPKINYPENLHFILKKIRVNVEPSIPWSINIHLPKLFIPKGNFSVSISIYHSLEERERGRRRGRIPAPQFLWVTTAHPTCFTCHGNILYR